MKLNVSCIQRFSTGDGPGIRTTVFLKGCNLRCPWCHNPENISAEPQTLLYKTGKMISYGKMTDTDDIVNDVIEDIEYYRQSGGGVTLSGGEPMLQPEGAGELSRKLKEKDVDVIIDTAGCVPYELFNCVTPYVDTFYFDYKTANGVLYDTVIKGNKSLILDNLKKLIASGKNVHARIPLIPGFNTGDKECEDICRDLLTAKVEYADLLPFHRLGSSKYEALGVDYKYKNTVPPTRETVDKIKEIYGKYFITNIE